MCEMISIKSAKILDDSTMASPDQQRISDQLVRLVQVFFALVLGQSLLLYRSVLLDPFSEKHWLATLALATMFYTTVASWVDWHVVMAHRPDGRAVCPRDELSGS